VPGPCFAQDWDRGYRFALNDEFLQSLRRLHHFLMLPLKVRAFDWSLALFGILLRLSMPPVRLLWHSRWFSGLLDSRRPQLGPITHLCSTACCVLQLLGLLSWPVHAYAYLRYVLWNPAVTRNFDTGALVNYTVSRVVLNQFDHREARCVSTVAGPVRQLRHFSCCYCLHFGSSASFSWCCDGLA
jgi:hypothetical protein